MAKVEQTCAVIVHTRAYLVHDDVTLAITKIGLQNRSTKKASFTLTHLPGTLPDVTVSCESGKDKEEPVPAGFVVSDGVRDSAKRPNYGCRMSMERGCFPAAPHKIKEIKVKVGGGVEAVLKEKFTDAKGKERWR